MNNEINLPSGKDSDAELLQELMNFLMGCGKELGIIRSNMREFSPFIVLPDGTQTEIAPLDALDDLSSRLAAKFFDIGFRQAGRDADPNDTITVEEIKQALFPNWKPDIELP